MTHEDLFNWDLVVVSTSGGKDSQAMLSKVARLAAEQGYPTEKIIAVHADLGQVEWAGVPELAEAQANFYGIPFAKVSRPQGDLLSQVEVRGMWPSSSNRYCTSDQKRDQVAKVITAKHREWKRTHKHMSFRVLQCIGLRAQESPARAKRLPFERNSRLSTKSREVLNWHPILDWTEEQVWERINKDGAPHHQAYDLGMPRLSCVFCVFSPKAALVLAGKHNPELLEKYVRLEERIGHKFRQDVSMAEIKAEIGGKA